MPKNSIEDIRESFNRLAGKKRKPGRPVGSGVKKYTIQEHIFLDRETADLLAALAAGDQLSKSAFIRELIQNEGERRYEHKTSQVE